MSFVAIAGASAGVSAGVGLTKSIIANRKQKRLVASQNQLIDDQFLPDMNKRYLDTEQGQSFLSTMRDRMKQSNQQVLDRSAITGGTDEATLAMRDANTRTYGSHLNTLQGYGTQYSQGLKDRYMQGKNQMFQASSNMNSQESASGANMFSNSMNSIGSLAMLPMLGKS